MTSVTILWVYIVLLIAGGIFGFVKAGSKPSLIASSIFGALLAMCALNIIPVHYATWLMGALVLVFGMRLIKTKKFMPSGLMVILTLLVLLLAG